MSTPRQFYRNVYFLSTSDSLNSTTASVIVTGGLSIQKNTNILGNLTVSNVTSTGLTTGNINFTGNLYQNNVPYIGSQWTGTSGSLYYGTGGSFVGINTTSPSFALDVNGNARTLGLTTGNINFTGNLYQNGSPYIGSQWTGSTGTLLYYGSGGAMIGINTSTPSYTLDVNGNARTLGFTTGNIQSTGLTTGNIQSSGLTTGNIQSTGLTTGNINFTGNLYQNSIPYIGSQWAGTSGTLYYGSGGSTLVGINTTNPTSTLTVAGDLFVSGNTTLSNFILGNFSSSSLITNIVNVASTSYIYGGVATIGNNVVTATNVNGLIFPTATTRSFTVKLSTSTICSTTPNYFYQSTIEGVLTDSGWVIETNFVGNTPNITFSISGTGQIMYTSTNVINWTSTTVRYQATGYYLNGSSLPPSITTSGNFSINSLSVTSTTDSINTSTGSAIISGGLGVVKSLNIGGSFSVTGTGTIPNVIHTNMTTTSLLVTGGGLISTFNSNTLGNLYTTGGNVGINTTSPSYVLDVNGQARFTNNVNVGNTVSNQISINITSNSSGLSLISGNNDTKNYIQYNGDLNFSKMGNTTPVIYIQATSANVGINTGSPIYPLHVTGNIYAGPSTFTNSGLGTINTIGLYTKGVFNSNVNGFPSTSGTVGNAIALRVRGADDGSMDFGVNSGNGSWIQTTNWASGYNQNYPLLLNPNGGNVGINTTSPTFALDVNGNVRTLGLIATTGTIPNVIHTNMTTTSLLVTGGLISTFNSNTLGNLYTTGGNVGINTTSPNYPLDVVGLIRSTTLAPVVGSNDIIHLGQSESNNNMAIIDYNYTTVGSSLNSIGLGFYGANNKLVVQAGGNVGINTNNPSYTLDVNGNMRVSSTITQAGGGRDASFVAIATAGQQAGIALDSTSGGGNRYNIYSDPGTKQLQFFNVTTTNASLNLDSRGNLGIGIANPVYTLDVSGSLRSSTLNSTSFSPAHTLINTGVNYPSVLSLLTPNITIGNFNTTFFGQSLSNGNSGQFSFLYNGNNNTGNSLFLSLYGGSGSQIFLNNNGNIGINTSSPGYTLDVNGSARISGSINMSSNYTSTSGGNIFANYLGYNYGSGIVCNGFTFGSPYFMTTQYQSNTGLDSVYLYTPGTGSASVKMSILHNGNIGINTTSPAYPLHVIGNIYAGPAVYSGTSINLLGLYTKGVFNSNVNGFPATSGTVGNAIALRVRGADDASMDFGVNSGNGSWIQSTNWASGYNQNYPLLLNPNGGNVCINTTSANAKLNILNNTAFSGSGDFSNLSGHSMTIQDVNSYSRINHLSADSTVSAVFNFQSGKNIFWGENTDTGSYIFRGRSMYVYGSNIINVAGGYYFNGGTSSIQSYNAGNQTISIFASSAILTQSHFLASSDLRIKNICNEKINLNLIDSINPVIYTYKDRIKNSKKNIGFIAQNVIEFCPEAVTLHKEIIPDIMKVVNIIENKDGIITIKNEWNLVKNDIIKIIIDDKDTNGELITIIYSDKDVIKFKHKKIKEKVFIYGRQVDDFHELNYDYVFALGFAGIQESRKEIKQLKQQINKLTEFIKSKFQDEF